MNHIISIVLVCAGALWGILMLSAFVGKTFDAIRSALRRNTKSWKADAIEADAIVLKVEHTGWMMNHKSLLRLQMQVKPGKGRNFVTELKCKYESSDIREGSLVKVKFNPLNTREIFLLSVNPAMET